MSCRANDNDTAIKDHNRNHQPSLNVDKQISRAASRDVTSLSFSLRFFFLLRFVALRTTTKNTIWLDIACIRDGDPDRSDPTSKSG